MRFLFMVSLVFLLGCAADVQGPPRRVIGVSLLSLTNPFFKEIGDNITAEAAKHGYDVVIVSGDNDVDRQNRQVADFLVMKVDAIILSPCDSKAIGESIRAANAAGVPVFTVDIAVLAEGGEVVTHVATDNYEGGKQAAEAVIELLRDRGGAVGILDFKEVESCILRVNGFKEVIEAHNAKAGVAPIRIVAELPSKGAKDQGFKSTEDMLQAHPDLAVIFAINDPAALGARAALEKAGIAERIRIVGFDGQPEGKRAIGEGKLYADPIQYPDRIGRTAVTSMVDYFEGERVPREKLIPTALYRQSDAIRDGFGGK